jgi:flagellar biosynthesis/type III secretory pathway protein FliH
MPGIYFGKMEQKNSIEWLIEKFYNNEGMITTKQLEKAKEMYNKEIEESYQDGREAVIIESIATLSTIRESSYSKGYNEGYLKALESMTKRY